MINFTCFALASTRFNEIVKIVSIIRQYTRHIYCYLCPILPLISLAIIFLFLSCSERASFYVSITALNPVLLFIYTLMKIMCSCWLTSQSHLQLHQKENFS